MKTAEMKSWITIFLLMAFAPALAQEKSVNPGINDSFQNPSVEKYVERFEKEGREVYDKREKIVEALQIKPGMTVADVGSGTGLFSRLIAPKVGSTGKLYSVDIAKTFVNHTVLSCHTRGWKHVEGIVCSPDDAKLPAESVDLVFICATFHHFEFPLKTMKSIHRALKPGGMLVIIDFEKIEGKSSDWIIKHMRAGKEVFRRETEKSGFELVEELDLFKDNYFLRFRKK